MMETVDISTGFLALLYKSTDFRPGEGNRENRLQKTGSRADLSLSTFYRLKKEKNGRYR
jgi:hypothetical protein